MDKCNVENALTFGWLFSENFELGVLGYMTSISKNLYTRNKLPIAYPIILKSQTNRQANRKIVAIFPPMKRTQLIEWGIITVALIFGYKFFEALFSMVVQIVYDFGNDGIGSSFIRLLIISAIYAVAFIFLIRKSSQIATWVNGQGENETIAIKINKRPLLQVILIGICAVTILSNITEIILYLFEAFKSEVGRRHDLSETSVSKYRFKVAAVQTIVALVVLFFSKDISTWFVRKNEADELTFDSNPEN